MNRGEIIGILGPNASGKTTLMYSISGIILDIKKKEEMRGGERITILGKIIYENRDITYLKPSLRARIGIILCPERRRVFPESSVIENLKIGGYIRNRHEIKEGLREVFKIFPELKKLSTRPAGLLSGGEQQILAIGRALMAKPKLLLWDEPLLGLAPIIQQRVLESIKEIKNSMDVTILITEQYARPIMKIIDRGYIIENGSISYEGDREELLNNINVRRTYLGL